MARLNRSGDWAFRFAPSLDELESLVYESFSQLPVQFQNLCRDLTIRIVDFPSEPIMDDMGLESPFELLGLFEGKGLGSCFSMIPETKNNLLILFRRPILDYWSENEETLGDIIAHILVHEIGHHFGLSEDMLDSIDEERASPKFY